MSRASQANIQLIVACTEMGAGMSGLLGKIRPMGTLRRAMVDNRILRGDIYSHAARVPAYEQAMVVNKRHAKASRQRQRVIGMGRMDKR